MTSPFSYTTTYILDKSHFSETFDASVTEAPSKEQYAKSVALIVVGLVLMYGTDISGYFCWFLIAIGAVDGVGVYYRKPWWLARQMLSKAANNELTLTIDEQGVSSKSLHVDSQLLWSDISRIEKTPQGWLLHVGQGKSYLSDRCLSDEARAYVAAKAT